MMSVSTTSNSSTNSNQTQSTSSSTTSEVDSNSKKKESSGSGTASIAETSVKKFTKNKTKDAHNRYGSATRCLEQSNNHSLGLGRASNIAVKTNHVYDHTAAPFYDAAQELLKTTFSASINSASFTGRNNLSSKNVPKSYQGILEIEMDSSLYCRHCKQLKKNYCHRVVYSDYIKKKLFSMYSNKGRQPGIDEFTEKMTEAYNEARRVNYHRKFNFYDAVHYEMPGCLAKYSMEIVRLMQEVVEATKINDETREGVIQMIKAKRHRKG